MASRFDADFEACGCCSQQAPYWSLPMHLPVRLPVLPLLLAPAPALAATDFVTVGLDTDSDPTRDPCTIFYEFKNSSRESNEMSNHQSVC